jgi:hypothetical protein
MSGRLHILSKELRRSVALVTMLGAAACGGEVTVLQVDPNQVPSDADTVVVIYGDGFEWEYSPLFNAVQGDFRVFADDTELTDVEWLDTTRIRATVPAGIAPGLHAVVVEMEHRQEAASLDDALLVTASQ